MAEEIDYKKMAEAQAIANAKYLGKTGGAKPGTGQVALDAAMKETSDAMSPFGKNLKDGGELAKKGLEAVHKAVTDGLGSWRDLSKSGAGFNNDIVGMTVAAAGTRMPLADFASVVKENASSFAGLGGNVTRGAEAFAKLGKEMFDSGITDSLKQLGYTNKDLNEVLALQMGTVRGSMRDDQASRKAAIQSAADLANEMDLMAKMTGRTREEQQEAMKKAQGDASVEAKLRLIGIKEGPEAEKKARLEFLKQYNEAEAQGRGQMFKEVFATGQIMSKEAATQAALDGKAAEATRNAAVATSKGDAEAASKFNAEARVETLKLNQDETRLRQATLGKAGGVASDSISATMMNKTARADYDATQSIKGEDKFKNASEAELLAESKRRAQEAQQGKDKEGTDVSGVTKAAVQLGNRLDDVQSAVTKGLLDPLNKEIGPKLKTFAEKYLSGNDFEGSGKRLAPAIEGAMARGNKAAQADGAPDRMTQPDEAGLVTGIAKTTGFTAGKLLKGAGAGLDKVNNIGTPKPIPKLAVGGPVEEGEPYIVGDGGEEELFVPKTAGDIIPKSMLAPKGLGSRSNNKQGGGLNLNEISKDISTTVSGGGSSTVKGPDMKEMSMSMAKMGMKDDQKKVFDEMMSLSSQQSKEKLQSLMEEKSSAQLANIEAAKARDAIEERLEAEGKGIKDLVGADKERFDALTAQMNSSADAQDKAKEAIQAAERAEQNRLSLQKMGYEVGIKQEEDKVKAVEVNSETIKAHIADALPIKEIAAKQEEFQSQFTESQQKILDDYKGYSEGNRVAHAEAMESGIKEDTETAKIIAARISKMKADIGDRQATEEETAALANEEANKKLFENRVEDKKEMLDIMQNLEEYSATRELELKKSSVANINSALTANTTQEGKLLSSAASGNAMNEVVAGSSPTASQGRGITADSITIGPNGMPVAKPKSTAAAAPDKPAEKKASPGKAINPETGEEYTPLSELEKQAGSTKAAPPKPAGGSDKAATLDDVVKSLNALNTKMGQLIDVNDAGHKASAKAAKSGSANLYNK